MNMRRNLYIPDDLYERIQRAAAEEGARCGRTVSLSEWLREAAEEHLLRGPIVYEFRNTANGRRYIGSTVHAHTRRVALARPNGVMGAMFREDFERCGPESFVFCVLERVGDEADLTDREQYWIDRADPDTLYNRYRKANRARHAKPRSLSR